MFKRQEFAVGKEGMEDVDWKFEKHGSVRFLLSKVVGSTSGM